MYVFCLEQSIERLLCNLNNINSMKLHVSHMYIQKDVNNMIGCIGFYVVSTIFQPYNVGDHDVLFCY